jgi:hypothetical protein
MNAQDFVSELESASPSVAALEALGMSRAEAEEIAARYRPLKRPHPVVVDAALGALGQLLGTYDCSCVEIGMVRFASAPAWDGACWVIGKVEADPLVLEPGTGLIRVEELGTARHVLWNCAKEGGAFLTALATAAALLGRLAVDEQAEEDKGALARTLQECTQLAGGGEYEAFYRMLLGVE